jgi:hypothetical protein
MLSTKDATKNFVCRLLSSLSVEGFMYDQGKLAQQNPILMIRIDNTLKGNGRRTGTRSFVPFVDDLPGFEVCMAGSSSEVHFPRKGSSIMAEAQYLVSSELRVQILARVREAVQK